MSPTDRRSRFLRAGLAALILYSACSFLWVGHLRRLSRVYGAEGLFGDGIRKSLKDRIEEASATGDAAEAEALGRELRKSLELSREARDHPVHAAAWAEGLEAVGGIGLALYIGGALVLGGKAPARERG